MSVFSPLNLVEGASKKDLEEEHTRETEYQNAFKLFQDAMKLKQEGKLAASYLKFQELASLDIILNHYGDEESLFKGIQNGLDATAQPDAVSYLHQNVKNLRYLYFRNRGFLYFAILKSNINVDALVEFENAREEMVYTPDSFKKELFYDMLDGFSICPIYQEPDESVLRVLDDLYAFLDMPRLRRFVLEYAVSFRDESDDISSVIPLNAWAAFRLADFKSSSPSAKESSLAEKLAFLTPYRDDLQQHCDEILRRKFLSIDLDVNVTWTGVISAMNLALKQHQAKNSELTRQNSPFLNSYLSQATTQDVVMFNFDTTKVMPESDKQNSPESEIIDSNPIVIEDTPMSDSIQEIEPMVDEDASELAKATSKLDTAPGAEKSTMRISKRLNREDYQPMEVDGILLTRHYFAETEVFFQNLNERLTSIFNSEKPILNDIINRIVATDNEKIEPRYISIFLQTLNEWKPKLYNPVLLAKVHGDEKKENLKDSDKKRLMDILTKFGNQISEIEVIEDDNNLREDSESVKLLLQNINATKKHINESKIEILFHLSKTIAEKSWEVGLFDTVFEWYMHLEAQIFQQYSKLSYTVDNIESIEFLLSIYEVIINYYIHCKDSLERSLESISPVHLKSMKGSLSLGSIEVLRVHYRITKWKSFFEGVLLNPELSEFLRKNNLSVLVRFLWATNYFISADNYSWKEKRYVVAHLDKLHSLVSDETASQLTIAFPNYQNIGKFSAQSLRRRLSTASILSIFSKILDQSGSESSNDTIFLLETILLDTNTENDHVPMPETTLVESILNGQALFDKESLSSVKTFFGECPMDLKLSLWNMLFSYYRSHSHEKYQAGFEQFLTFIISFMESPEFVKENSDDPVMFIRLIFSYTSYLDVFLKNLMEDKWILKGDQIKTHTINNLSRIFELCYSFSLHEESALITGCKVSLESRSKEAFSFFKDLCIKSVTTLMVYSVNQINRNDSIDDKDERISDLVSLVHYQLGIRRLCDAANGLFLTFAEDNLMKLQNFPTTEITQLMSCRLHYKIKVGGKFPVDHFTSNRAELNKSNATELAAFIVPLCFEDNPLTQNFRSDLKQVVEDIYDIFGYPEIESDTSISENWSVLENFLDSVTLGPRFIKEVFHGLSPITFLPASRENEVARKGIYYLQAVLMFNSYKVRKKSAQSRTVELERIIALLKCDLIYGSNRVESWILLGQAYGFIVEDDTIWTSDKLNIPERKVLIAISQKKALACYMMGIGTVTRADNMHTESDKAIIGVLMNSFVKEMYSASRAPMDSIAFKVFKTPRFTQKDGNKSYNQVSERPAVSARFCLLLMQRCLDIALKSDPSDWTSWYYLGKVRSKLSANPEVVLEAIDRSNKLAKDASSSSDPILEPSYKYYSLLYKFVKYDSISVRRGFELADKEVFLMMKSDLRLTEKRDFYLHIAACLTKLSSLDKKQWYHKPSYRLATIVFEELNDSAWARRAISRFFTLKSHNKTFLQMWKPENERPGKHFVYMYQYTQFFLSILEKDKDLTLMISLFPKLRRANSSMVHLYPAWERMCSILCQLVREITRVESNLVERFLFMTTHANFIKEAKGIVEQLPSNSPSPATEMNLKILYELMEIRKLNNGYGPTSLIDDTFAGVFVKIYNEYVGKFSTGEGDQHPSSPNGKAKRLAKKDLFPFAVELAGKQKRAVETQLKSEPDFFNAYVTEYLIEEVKRSERSLFQNQRVWATYMTSQQLKLSNRKMILSTVPGSHSPDFFISKPKFVPQSIPTPAKQTTRLDGLSSLPARHTFGTSWQTTPGILPPSLQNHQFNMPAQIVPGKTPYLYYPVSTSQNAVHVPPSNPIQSSQNNTQTSSEPSIKPPPGASPIAGATTNPSSQQPMTSSAKATHHPTMKTPITKNYASTTKSQPATHHPATTSVSGHGLMGDSHGINGEHPKCEICERNYALQNKLPYFKVDPKSIPASYASPPVKSVQPTQLKPTDKRARASPVEDVFHDSQSLLNMRKSVSDDSEAMTQTQTPNFEVESHSKDLPSNVSSSASDAVQNSKPLTRRRSEILRKEKLAQNRASPQDIVVVNDDPEPDSSSSEEPARKKTKSGSSEDSK